MHVFEEFLSSIETSEHKTRTKVVLDWVEDTFPELKPEFKWNQPMFTHHGTFIIAFSISKKHLACAPERAGIVRFEHQIKEAGYESSTMLFRLPWNKEVNYQLLKEIIEFNMFDKANHDKFWR